jgi:hypothetical protein
MLWKPGIAISTPELNLIISNLAFGLVPFQARAVLGTIIWDLAAFKKSVLETA